MSVMVITSTHFSRRRARATVTAAFAAFALAATPSPASASPAWEDGKAYTAMLKESAEVAAAAVATAAAAVGAATKDLSNARVAFQSANTAAATTAATLAAVAEAEAAVAAATAILAAAETAAAAAAAIAAGATIGTLIGQGLRGLWTLCWDPICSLASLSIGSGPIYRAATTSEIAALVPTLVETGTGRADIDLRTTGAAGALSEAFIADGARMFIDASRAAAAFTAGRSAEVRAAIPDLQAQLFAYRGTMANFASLLASTSLTSPFADLAVALAAFDAARMQLLSVCDASAGDDCVALAASFATARAKLQAGLDAIAGIEFRPLVGTADAFFPRLSIDEFLAFLAATASEGATALPVAEIALADFLLAAADVEFPGEPSFGPALAAYDATGDIGGRESALFDPITRKIDLAQLLFRSATTHSTTGYWLEIDLADSPVTRAVTEPSTILLLAAALGAALRRRRVASAAT